MRRIFDSGAASCFAISSGKIADFVPKVFGEQKTG
jgi:hypothetical protein